MEFLNFGNDEKSTLCGREFCYKQLTHTVLLCNTIDNTVCCLHARLDACGNNVTMLADNGVGYLTVNLRTASLRLHTHTHARTHRCVMLLPSMGGA